MRLGARSCDCPQRAGFVDKSKFMELLANAARSIFFGLDCSGKLPLS